MKKLLLLLCIVSITFAAHSQTPSIPNGNFEQWSSGTCDNPQYYQNTSNAQNYFYYHLPFNVTKVTDAYHGSYAVQLSTNATATDTSFAYFVNVTPDGPPSSWTGGMPYTQKPTGIRGHFKYNVATADSATILVAFSKAGVNIGSYLFNIGGIHTSYTLFNFTLSPALSVTPDSVIFAALSCKLNTSSQKPGGPPGSTLILDSVSFTGVTSQPTQFNGDFELWQSQTYNSPDNWYIQGDMGEGFNKTTDAKAGNFAIELTTFLGDNNGQPVAREGRISTGYYPNNCNPCNELGGFPFSNQIDTLAFWYKYVPAHPADSANIYINFKKNSSSIWGANQYLLAAANYQYMEIPFNTNTPPDSVMIDIQSSLWQNQDLSYVGADLKIDEIHFKSQPLNTGILNLKIENKLRIFPNPTNGKIQISGADIQGIEVINVLGESLFRMSNIKQLQLNVIDLSNLLKGIYFIKIFDGEKMHTEKIVKE